MKFKFVQVTLKINKEKNHRNIIIHTLQIVRDNNSYKSSSLELQKPNEKSGKN
jgi:hypothetical protein